jgi:molybdenum cofactor cytidylyltransferase
MIFAELPIDEAVGAYLAHSLKIAGKVLKKGRKVDAVDLELLRKGSIERVMVAKLDANDVHEDSAAAALAQAIAGEGVSLSAAFTGRVNLFADAAGVLALDRDRVDAVNLVDEGITLATLEPFAVVEPKQMIATVKIIPFSVPQVSLNAVVRKASADGPLLRVASFTPRKVGLIQTRLPSVKESVLDKTQEVTRARLAACGSELAAQSRAAHTTQAVASAIGEMIQGGMDVVLIQAASAITDRRDVIPTGIEAAGGQIEHFGMPVDPGNLMLLAKVGAVPVLGLPGCARSPKLNGFDWLLQRVLAGVAVSPRDIMRMGAGGLLMDIPTRPLPREEAVRDAPVERREWKIGAIVLAAGQSRRMGRVNKLIAEVEGKPMIAHTAEAALAARVHPVVVVTGHESERIREALAGLEVEIVENRYYAAGLSTSLQRGLAALPADLDGAVVCLGDMPRVRAEHINLLIDGFDPDHGREICVPVANGKRGNPVLWARRFFADMGGAAGDAGAKYLLGQHAQRIAEVPMPDEGVLLDVDTPTALASLTAAERPTA